MKTKRKPSSGQAVLEYLLVVVFAVLSFATLINNIGSNHPQIGMCRFWAIMVKSVATGCANCPSVSDMGDNPVCFE